MTPLILLGVYTFVFGTILEIRWVTQSGGNAEFAAILFSGMLVHGILAECLTQGMTLFLSTGEVLHQDATARDVFDVSGAGDTVVAIIAVV